MPARGLRTRRHGEEGDSHHDPLRYAPPKPPANDDRRPLGRLAALTVLKILILAAAVIVLITAISG